MNHAGTGDPMQRDRFGSIGLRRKDHRDGSIAGQCIGGHLPIARLKRPERQQAMWQEHNVREWEKPDDSFGG
jgi:hypothetical protein